jgi:hypothetical protein
VSDLSEKLSPAIHKALLANGVQLTGKELGPVSKDVAAYVKNNFEAVSKHVQAEVAADKKKADEAKKLEAPKAIESAQPPKVAAVRGGPNAPPFTASYPSAVYPGAEFKATPVSGGALKAPPAPGGRSKQ